HPTHQVDSQTAAGGPTIAPSAEMLKNSNTAVEQKLVLTDLIHPDIDPQMRSTRPIPFLTPRSLQTPDTIPLDRFGPGTGRVSTDPITGQEFPSTNEDWNLRNAAAMFLSILFVPAENDWVVLQEILRTPDIELNDRADGLLDRQAQFGNPPAANQDSSKSVESILKEFDPTLVVL
ncbi:MAG: hypothetical protein O7C75_18955, partial [Verrucomicrobia bacterium]|nr:hypothetical protein [Verrucomicrobiota bacterium]